jgi:SPP1 family predicted phage head-tail adaptor
MTRFEQILNREGENVTWHKRQEGSIDSETGDRTITWTTEIIKAVVHTVSTHEIVAEAGYTSEDYIRVFVTSDIKHKDKITYNGREYEVLPPESVYFRGVLEHRTALCRRMAT